MSCLRRASFRLQKREGRFGWTTAPAELLVLQEADGGRSAELYRAVRLANPTRNLEQPCQVHSLAGRGDSFVTRACGTVPWTSAGMSAPGIADKQWRLPLLLENDQHRDSPQRREGSIRRRSKANGTGFPITSCAKSGCGIDEDAGFGARMNRRLTYLGQRRAPGDSESCRCAGSDGTIIRDRDEMV